jgi:hypothetical protein
MLSPVVIERIGAKSVAVLQSDRPLSDQIRLNIMKEWELRCRDTVLQGCPLFVIPYNCKLTFLSEPTDEVEEALKTLAPIVLDSPVG